MSQITLVKKLSAKTIVTGLKGLVKKLADGEVSLLFRVYGIARGLKKGESDFGAWTAFVGEFEAVTTDGEIFRAQSVFLPEIAESLLIGPVADSDGSGVKFAFDIGVKANESLVIGYEYTVKPVIEVADNDALSQFRAELPKLAIAAPKQPELISTDGGEKVVEEAKPAKAKK